MFKVLRINGNNSSQGKLQNFIKLTSYLGYLPVTWSQPLDAEKRIKFRFSKTKVLLACTIELILTIGNKNYFILRKCIMYFPFT